MKFVKPSQLDQKNPGTWPIYYKVLVWIVLIVLVWYLYGNFFRKDLLSAQSRNQSEINQKQEQFETLYQFSLDLPLYEERQAELINRLSSLLQFLPAETEMPSLIDATYNAGYANNINFTGFKPEASKVRTYYNVEPISLSTNAGYTEFAQFVQQIGELPRILNVRRFDMSVNGEDSDLLRITSDLETYIYNQDISKLFGDNGESK